MFKETMNNLNNVENQNELTEEAKDYLQYLKTFKSENLTEADIDIAITKIEENIQKLKNRGNKKVAEELEKEAREVYRLIGRQGIRI